RQRYGHQRCATKAHAKQGQEISSHGKSPPHPKRTNEIISLLLVQSTQGAGRTHQIVSSFEPPPKISSRNSGSSPAAFRFRAILSFREFCLSKHSAILRSSAKFAAP